MSKGTGSAPIRRPNLRAHQAAAVARAAAVPRSSTRRPHPCISESGYTEREFLFLRAAERYRAENQIESMRATDYLHMMLSNGWLEESALRF